jgi:hypothetical protein
MGVYRVTGKVCALVATVVVCAAMNADGCVVRGAGGVTPIMVDQSDGSSSVWLWISAVKDTHVIAQVDANYGGTTTMSVAGVGPRAFEVKRSYIQFYLPGVPDGTVVEAAYLNLFHGGTREDGQTDELSLHVQRASAPWNVFELTAANEPPFSPGFEFGVNLRSAAWSGSGDISSLVANMFLDPSLDNGFIVHTLGGPGGVRIDKGLSANQDPTTGPGGMPRTPRLLVLVTLPRGATTDDIVLPPLPADTDISTFGVPPVMVRAAPGTALPAEWEVAVGF